MFLLRTFSRVMAVCTSVTVTVAAGAMVPGAVEPAKAGGEQWEVTTLVEYYGPKDRTPSRTNRETRTLCLKPGSVDMSAELNTELPADMARRCQLGEKRADDKRQQVKFVCNSGATAEAATRREADGSFSSQIVANVPQEWAVSIVRNVRRVAGSCDPAIATPPQPVPPATPR